MCLASACGSASAPVSAPVSAPPPPAADPLADVAWMEGRWQTGTAQQGGAEHWTRVGDALHGIGFIARGGKSQIFEVLVISRKNGALTYTAMPAGQKLVDFPLLDRGERKVTFANPKHDFPRSLHYEREGDTLRAQAAAPGAGTEHYSWQLAGAGRAEELEAADRAFAGDVAARGLDAWVHWFDPEGVQWRDGPVTGPERIRHLMAPAFARADFRILWTPVASGMSPAGDLGYTIGTSRITWSEDGVPAPPYCGSYATIWRRQVDGSWRVLFDAGWQLECDAKPAG
jgi:ketosteroid isomerase-like protein